MVPWVPEVLRLVLAFYGGLRKTQRVLDMVVFHAQRQPYVMKFSHSRSVTQANQDWSLIGHTLVHLKLHKLIFPIYTEYRFKVLREARNDFGSWKWEEVYRTVSSHDGWIQLPMERVTIN